MDLTVVRFVLCPDMLASVMGLNHLQIKEKKKTNNAPIFFIPVGWIHIKCIRDCGLQMWDQDFIIKLTGCSRRNEKSQKTNSNFINEKEISFLRIKKKKFDSNLKEKKKLKERIEKAKIRCKRKTVDNFDSKQISEEQINFFLKWG